MSNSWRVRFDAAMAAKHTDLIGGNADRCSFALDSVTLRSGSVIHMEHAGVTAIVGANNAGKSTILREIVEALDTEPRRTEAERMSVARLTAKRTGTAADLAAWLGERSPFLVNSNYVGFQTSQGMNVAPYAIKMAWEDDEAHLGAALRSLLCFYGNAEGRLHEAGSGEMRDSITDPPSRPVHYLQDNRELFLEVSRVSEAIFGQPLTLDTLAKKIRLRVGSLDLPTPRLDEVTPEYLAQLARLRPLDQQGDGMRSLLGQLLPIMTASHPVVLIDEPEAFLHPPQAHALGKELGRLSSDQKTQVIVATHDRNLLTGLLESGARTTVARISRPLDGDAIAHQLPSQALREIWTDPVLKYTNILDGLFHRVVVTAEAEGDCAFLAAALDSRGDDTAVVPSNEVLFVPTGGKDGMPKVARALTAVNVPVVAAPDFDRISDKVQLSLLVQAVGAAWTPEMERLWSRATARFRNRVEPARVEHVLDAIQSALSDRANEPYSEDHREIIRAQSRASVSPWAEVKDHGVNAFRGDARTAVEELLKMLDAARVVLLREGELERLAPEVAVRKGPGWTHAALAIGAQKNSATQRHIQRILDSAALTHSAH